MAFKLVEVERAMNINDNIHRTKAVSNDREPLELYCNEKLRAKVIEEPLELEDFPMDDFYIIVERHDLVIL